MQKPNVFEGFSRVLSGGGRREGLRPMIEAFFFALGSGGPAVSQLCWRLRRSWTLPEFLSDHKQVRVFRLVS